MENNRAFADILNECLEALAAGEASIEECLARYPAYAPNLEGLLRLGDAARGVSLPAPTPEMLAAGEQRLVQAARSKTAQVRGEQKNTNLLDALKAKLRAGPKWVLPVVALSASVAALFICAILVVIGASLAWRNIDALHGAPTAAVAQEGRDGFAKTTPTTTGPTVTVAVVQSASPLPEPTATLEDESAPVYTVYLPLTTSPLPPHRAMLQELRGVVEVQGVDGVWSAASDRQIVEAGVRVRTGVLSSANVMFYDGSMAYLEPNTEVSIDTLGQNPEDQSRIVELTQWVGETDHEVAPSYGAKGRYEVHTPSGTGAAKGTFFHVSVTTALVVQFRVDEGAVEVSNLNVTVVVIAGQLTTIQPNTPPARPVFRVSGEGKVEATGTTWRIAGQNFQTHAATVIVGNPQVGDWVRVDGRLLADGTRVADWIVLLRRAPANRFTLTGHVEAMDALTWTVAGQEIAVDEATVIDEGIQIGDRVRVEGVIAGAKGGTLLAETIALVDERGVPFSFVGVVQEIAESYWVVSGVSVTLDAETIIADNLVVGDIARVRGVFLDGEDTTWLARAIEPVEPPGPRFAFTGKVEATGTITWTVAGQAITVDGETEIAPDIEVGDWVRVEGRIEPDGMLWAESIRPVETPALSFAFAGTIEEMADDTWIVSGISVTVDAETVIDDDLAVGDVVRVRGQVLADGTWLARSIRRLVIEEHKFEFVGLVEGIEPWVVSGIAIETRMWTEIKGEIKIGDRVKVEGRILPDGTWLAEEIKLADDDENLSFEFVGQVERIDPWVVAGIALTVDYRTEIKDEIAAGDRVKVEGQILPTGAWLATEIKLVDPGLGGGCMQFTSLVLRIGAGQILLQNGAALPLDAGVQIEGEVRVNSVILFYLCVGKDGQVIVTSIIVIGYVEPPPPARPTPPPAQPTTPPSQPPPPGGGSIAINDNNQTQTFTCNGHSVTINGNNNTITLLGRCGPVTVRGNNNWVSIQSAASVTNTGNNNTIVGP